MKLISTLIFVMILCLNQKSNKADEIKSDELSLRNQLFADVFLLKEGVDRLQISVEVLNKRFNNQMEILKGMQNKMTTSDVNSEEESEVCDRITGMFNATLRKQNVFESRLIMKLDEISDDQTTRLEEMLVKQTLSKNCSSQGPTATSSVLLISLLTKIDEKTNKFEEKLAKFETLEEKLNLQQTKLNEFMENQLKILQDINEKMAKNQEQITAVNKELSNLKTLATDVNKVVTQRRPKLPMEVILGLTSANVTTV